MSTRRYLVFAGPDYYAHGGWHDFVGSSDSLVTACERGREVCREKGETSAKWHWWHVVDTDTSEIVAGTKYQGYGGDDLKNGE